MGDDCFGDEWIKASWRKGECRQEIKMVAAASGLAFDDARIVVSASMKDMVANVDEERDYRKCASSSSSS